MQTFPTPPPAANPMGCTDATNTTPDCPPHIALGSESVPRFPTPGSIALGLTSAKERFESIGFPSTNSTPDHPPPVTLGADSVPRFATPDSSALGMTPAKERLERLGFPLPNSTPDHPPPVTLGADSVPRFATPDSTALGMTPAKERLDRLGFPLTNSTPDHPPPITLGADSVPRFTTPNSIALGLTPAKERIAFPSLQSSGTISTLFNTESPPTSIGSNQATEDSQDTTENRGRCKESRKSVFGGLRLRSKSSSGRPSTREKKPLKTAEEQQTGQDRSRKTSAGQQILTEKDVREPQKRERRQSLSEKISAVLRGRVWNWNGLI